MTTRREPMLNAPWIVVALILAVLGIQVLLDEVLASRTADEIFNDFAFQPVRTAVLLWPSLADDVALPPGWTADDLRQAVRDEAPYGVVSVLTYALLHGGWLHAGFNSIWLLVFGTAVARRLGNLRFVLFALGSSAAGSLVYLALHPLGVVPVVGASGLVMACMGASTRFAFLRQGAFGPALSLRQTFARGPALSFLAISVALVMLPAIGIGLDGVDPARIAWEAHIAGLAFGLLTFGWFDPLPRAAGTGVEGLPPDDVREPEAPGRHLDQ